MLQLQNSCWTAADLGVAVLQASHKLLEEVARLQKKTLPPPARMPGSCLETLSSGRVHASPCSSMNVTEDFVHASPHLVLTEAPLMCQVAEQLATRRILHGNSQVRWRQECLCMISTSCRTSSAYMAVLFALDYDAQPCRDADDSQQQQAADLAELHDVRVKQYAVVQDFTFHILVDLQR